MKKKLTKVSLRRKDDAKSIWAGRFESEAELEAFIDGGEFEEEQGFKIEPPLLPYHSFVEAGGDELIKSLISEWKFFKLANAALGSTDENSLILHEHFEFLPKRAPKGTKRMRFLCTL